MAERPEPQAATREQIVAHLDELNLREIAGGAAERLALYGQSLDELGALDLLKGLRDARKALAVAEGLLETYCARKAMRSQRVALSGAWVAERHFSKDRKEWDHQGLTAAVMERLLVDTSTGEVKEGAEFARGVWAARDALTTAARTDWRMTPLKEWGIDPDDYCRSTPGRATVQFVSAEEDRDASTGS